MRRSVLLFPVTLLVPFALMACEDGPNQTFSPAKGTLFNNGDSPSVVDDAGDPFNAVYGGGTKTEICTGDELQRQWSKMVHEPIRPPRFMGGLDLAGGTQFPGLTVESAEQGPLTPLGPNGPSRLCQPQVMGQGGNSSQIGGSLVVQWGNAGEMQMEWAVPTHKAYLVTLQQGYLGHMSWNYKTASDGKTHSYDWQIGQITQKDGADFNIDWDATTATPSCGTKCRDEVDELYRGIISNFAPELYQDVPTTCAVSGACGIFPTGNDGVHPVIGFRPAAFYMETYSPATSREAGSRMYQAYVVNVKFAPYSLAQTTLKMDKEGPVAGATPGDQNKTCRLALGESFKSLLDDCINVFKDPATDTLALNKVMGNLTHDDQNFTFSVVGVNQNYRPAALDLDGPRKFDVIHDTESPLDDPAHNFADDFTFDVRASGPILNDGYLTTDATKNVIFKSDNHGSGAIWREWGRLVQSDLAAAYAALHPRPANAESWPRSWHDSQCLFPMECQGGPACVGLGLDACGASKACTWAMPPSNSCQTQLAGQNGNDAVCQAHKDGAGCAADGAHRCTWWTEPNSWRPAEGCTGFEGMVHDGEPVGNEDDTFTWGYTGAFGSLKPGNPASAFCTDPGVFNFCGLSGDLSGSYGDLFGNALGRVIQYLGRGSLNDVPTEGRDLRFYFKKFTIAYAKYMTSPAALAGGANAATPAPLPDFRDQFLDYDYLIFDSYGAGGSRSEYVDFTHAGEIDANGHPQDPTDIELKFLLIGSNLQSTSFLRRLDREERGLFNAMAIDESQPAWAWLRDSKGALLKDELGFNRVNANMFLSNVFGSPALAGGQWAAPRDSAGNLIPAPAGTIDPCIAPGQAPMKTAYYCATHIDHDCAWYDKVKQLTHWQAPTGADGKILTRDNGKPLLDGYCGAFAPTAFALGSDAGLEIDEVATGSPGALPSPDPLTQTARVKIYDFAVPYDLKSKQTINEVLVPWKPKQEGVGFPVMNPASPLNDVFVETAQFEMTGQVMTPVIDFQDTYETDASNVTRHMATVQAVETEDFLGDVFLCVDPGTAANNAGTGRPGDVLAAHMYTSVASILEWLASHPGATDGCQIIVRYSPFNNYPDFIQGTANGVRLGVEQGAGFGRVSDVTIFKPGLGTTAAP